MDIHRSLGRIEGAQGAMQDGLTKLEHDLKRDLRETRKRVTKLEQSASRPPAVETALKQLLTYGLPLLTLWLTESVELALKALSAIKWRLPGAGLCAVRRWSIAGSDARCCCAWLCCRSRCFSGGFGDGALDPVMHSRQLQSESRQSLADANDPEQTFQRSGCSSC